MNQSIVFFAISCIHVFCFYISFSVALLFYLKANFHSFQRFRYHMLIYHRKFSFLSVRAIEVSPYNCHGRQLQSLGIKDIYSLLSVCF